MVLITACGFGVMDYLYTPVDYSSEAFKKYQSKSRGDGGLSPGHLCFVEAWEKYTGKSLKEIQKEQGWDRRPDTFNVGGPSIVACINAAQLLQTRGVKVKYYGAMAKDDTATRFLEITRKTPVDVSNLRIYDKGTSPFALCLSDPNYNNGAGERSFAVNIGVFGTVPAQEIVKDSFFEGDILFFGATALTPTIHQHLTSLLRRGKEQKKINVVATVFDHISEASRPGQRWSMGESDESFAYMDLLMVDYDEAMAISGCNTMEEAAAFFKKKGVKSLTVTHGSDPLYAYSDGSFFKEMPLRTFPVSAAITEDLKKPRKTIGDTTGCGDNFAGGILAYLGEAIGNGIKIKDLDLTEAIAWGCASGGFTCFIVGGTFLEKHPGEKRAIVGKYRQQYLSQIATSKL